MVAGPEDGWRLDMTGGDDARSTQISAVHTVLADVERRAIVRFLAAKGGEPPFRTSSRLSRSRHHQRTTTRGSIASGCSTGTCHRWSKRMSSPTTTQISAWLSHPPDGTPRPPCGASPTHCGTLHDGAARAGTYLRLPPYWVFSSIFCDMTDIFIILIFGIRSNVFLPWGIDGIEVPRHPDYDILLIDGVY